MAAINNLHASLGSPQLPGWVPSGGDPCGQGWQGVQCNGSDIITMYVLLSIVSTLVNIHIINISNF